MLNAQEYARILERSTEYNILSDEDVVIKENYKLEIKSPEGKRFAYFQEYIDKYRKIKSVEIVVKDQFEKKVKKLSKADGHEYGFNNSYEIDDSKIFIIDPDYQNYPYILEVSTEIKIKGFISLPPWIPRSGFNLSVAKSKLTIKYVDSFDINFREEHILSPKKTTEDGITTVTFGVSDLKAVDKNVRYRDFYENQPKVLITPLNFSLEDLLGSFRSWKDFGNWFLILNSQSYSLSEQTENFINNLDKTDKVSSIMKIYKYMQDRTRYISIQLGIGGFKSISTENVESNGYGDCKGLTTYMKNMLDYAGIESNYILVRAGTDAPEVKRDFPSNQFNHVYLGIPLGDTLFLECTSQTAPAFYTGSFTDDRNVLWIANDNSQIIRSKVYSIEANLQESVARIHLNDDGNSTMKLSIGNHGVFYDELMKYQSGNNSYIEEYNNSKFDYNDYTITNFAVDYVAIDSPIFTSVYDLEIIGQGKVLGDRMILPVNMLQSLNNYVDLDELRKYISVPRALTIIDSVFVDIPQAFNLFDIPKDVEVNDSYGSYKLNFKKEEGQVLIRRELKLKKGDHTGLEYLEYQKFWQKLKKVEKKKLILSSKT